MSASAREEIIELLHQECELLDAWRLDEWLALFTPDCRYWMPLDPAQTDPLAHFSLMIEDRELLQMRIERMRHPSAHGMDVPIRTSRMIGNIRITDLTETSAEASARFMLLESENDRLRTFGGLYRYTLAHEGGWKIRQKRVELVNADAPHASIQIII